VRAVVGHVETGRFEARCVEGSEQSALKRCALYGGARYDGLRCNAFWRIFAGCVVAGRVETKRVVAG